MPQSFASHHYHIVFSTKDRTRAIVDPPRMWRYLAGIAQGIDCLPIEIGGVEDHVHLLIFIPADIAVAKVVSQLKANASKWMGKGFGWQRGYASFTVSVSNLNSVKTYIATQPEHHKKRNFQQEYVALLKKHGVKYDERYVFD